MKILNAQEIKQVSGGALDPELGLFKPTGIALIDAIHKSCLSPRLPVRHRPPAPSSAFARLNRLASACRSSRPPLRAPQHP